MTQAGYERIKAALASLSADEAEMIVLALVNMQHSSFKEPLWQTAQEQAAAYLRLRREEND